MSKSIYDVTVNNGIQQLLVVEDSPTAGATTDKILAWIAANLNVDLDRGDLRIEKLGAVRGEVA